tara:strand:- start:453 stop:617 length:165 start_codon:yes stop_codon:yes gene_type:complete
MKEAKNPSIPEVSEGTLFSARGVNFRVVDIIPEVSEGTLFSARGVNFRVVDILI